MLLLYCNMRTWCRSLVRRKYQFGAVVGLSEMKTRTEYDQQELKRWEKKTSVSRGKVMDFTA